MVGFIKGLFGGKKKDDSVADSNAEQPVANKKETAYFLDPDSAKTFGNIDYMRTAKVVKRTFPKTVSNQAEFEVVQQVSAMAAAKLEEAVRTAEQASAASEVLPAPQKSTEAEERRRTDSSMDMFRNMAKDLKR